MITDALVRPDPCDDPRPCLGARRYGVECRDSLLPIESDLICRAAWTAKAHIEVGLIRQIGSRESHIPGTANGDDGRIKVDRGGNLQAGVVES